MYGNRMDTDNCTKLFAYECWRYLTNCCLDLFIVIDSVVSFPSTSATTTGARGHISTYHGGTFLAGPYVDRYGLLFLKIER